MNLLASPQYSVQVSLEAEPPPLHNQPDSTYQVEFQPSPFMLIKKLFII